MVRTSYAHHDRTVHIIAVRAGAERFPPRWARVTREAAVQSWTMRSPTSYPPLPASSPIDIDALAAEIGSLLRTVDLPASVRRVSLIPSIRARGWPC